MSYGLAVLGLALADRFLVKRNHIELTKLDMVANKGNIVRFAVGFYSKQLINNGTITYSIRDKRKPTTVITKKRALDFTTSNFNSEYLTFSKSKLEAESGDPISGEWIVDVKVERSCSRLNPLYKIFPTIATIQQEFYIE
jgi:isocitrate dehydrogenase